MRINLKLGKTSFWNRLCLKSNKREVLAVPVGVKTAVKLKKRTKTPQLGANLMSHVFWLAFGEQSSFKKDPLCPERVGAPEDVFEDVQRSLGRNEGECGRGLGFF